MRAELGITRKAHVKELEQTDEKAAVVKMIIESIEKNLTYSDATPTLSDLSGLLQLQRELMGETTGAVVIRWVDECQWTTDSEE